MRLKGPTVPCADVEVSFAVGWRVGVVRERGDSLDRRLEVAVFEFK